MSTFPLKIVTPDGLIYDGSAERLIVRSTTGDLAIMARHINFVTPLGMGRATVIADGQRREAACIGGMLSVVDGAVTLVPTTFEWADEIDAERAQRARQEAEERLRALDRSDEQFRIAEAKLKRALTRLHVRG